MEATREQTRKRSSIADIRRAQLAAMEQGNRPLVLTLELIIIHRSLEAYGLLTNDEPSELSAPTQP